QLLRLGELRVSGFDALVESGHAFEDHEDFGDLVDGGGGKLRLAVLHLDGDDAVVIRHGQIDGLFDDARVFLGGVEDLQDLFANNTIRTKRLVDAAFAFFDALGDVDFALAIEELDRAHLAQVHANGVIGLVDDSGRGGDDVLLDFFALIDFFFFDGAVDRDDPFVRRLQRLLGVLDDVDAEVVEADV